MSVLAAAVIEQVWATCGSGSRDVELRALTVSLLRGSNVVRCKTLETGEDWLYAPELLHYVVPEDLYGVNKLQERC